jgi:hypothetical protein
MGPVEWTVVVLVVGMRLALPLTIPYYPLPGVLACLILDAADQTIFQQFSGIALDRYQSYDKALDIYYLAITYLATMRNWTNRPAFRMSRFLYYYRLVGVVAFEISQVRLLLLIFPNTFEYFFIFYEAVRARWDTARLTGVAVVVAAALIWVFIKLPQEWWIHIAKLDVTEAVKEHLFGVSADASWGEAIAASPPVLVALIAGVAAVVGIGYWIAHRFGSSEHHPLRLKADPLPSGLLGPEPYRTARAASRFFDRSLLEKILLTGLVSVIFAQMLELGAGNFRLGFVAVFVIVNAFVSQLLARRGHGWRSVATELAGMMAVNYGIVAVLVILEYVLGLIDTSAPLGATAFFVFLFTVITVLFDRYHTVQTVRAALEPGGAVDGTEDTSARAVPG